MRDEEGYLLCDSAGHYIPQRDFNGCGALTGNKIAKVQINENTHAQPEELIVVAKRGKKNNSAQHLGFITIGELERLREHSNLRSTNCIQLDWLHSSPEDLIEEIKDRCRRYQFESRSQRS